MDSGTKSTDVEEFVSESYLASSKDIAEADESIKRLRVSGMTHEQNNSANLEFPLHKRQSINGNHPLVLQIKVYICVCN